MSHKDKTIREALASDLGQLKDKYSKLEQDYKQIQNQRSLNQTIVQPQGLDDTFYQEANIEAWG